MRKQNEEHFSGVQYGISARIAQNLWNLRECYAFQVLDKYFINVGMQNMQHMALCVSLESRRPQTMQRVGQVGAEW